MYTESLFVNALFWFFYFVKLLVNNVGFSAEIEVLFCSVLHVS